MGILRQRHCGTFSAPSEVGKLKDGDAELFHNDSGSINLPRGGTISALLLLKNTREAIISVTHCLLRTSTHSSRPQSSPVRRPLERAFEFGGR